MVHLLAVNGSWQVGGLGTCSISCGFSSRGGLQTLYRRWLILLRRRAARKLEDGVTQVRSVANSTHTGTVTPNPATASFLLNLL